MNHSTQKVLEFVEQKLEVLEHHDPTSQGLMNEVDDFMKRQNAIDDKFNSESVDWPVVSKKVVDWLNIIDPSKKALFKLTMPSRNINGA